MGPRETGRRATGQITTSTYKCAPWSQPSVAADRLSMDFDVWVRLIIRRPIEAGPTSLGVERGLFSERVSQSGTYEHDGFCTTFFKKQMSR